MNAIRITVIVKKLLENLDWIDGKSEREAERCQKFGGYRDPDQFLSHMRQIRMLCEPAIRSLKDIEKDIEESVQNLNTKDITSRLYAARSNLKAISSIYSTNLDVLYPQMNRSCVDSIDLLNELIDVLFE